MTTKQRALGPEPPLSTPYKANEGNPCVTVLLFKNLRKHTVVHKCVRILSSYCFGLDLRFNLYKKVGRNVVLFVCLFGFFLYNLVSNKGKIYILTSSMYAIKGYD